MNNKILFCKICNKQMICKQDDFYICENKSNNYQHIITNNKNYIEISNENYSIFINFEYSLFKILDKNCKLLYSNRNRNDINVQEYNIMYKYVDSYNFIDKFNIVCKDFKTFYQKKVTNLL